MAFLAYATIKAVKAVYVAALPTPSLIVFL